MGAVDRGQANVGTAIPCNGAAIVVDAMGVGTWSRLKPCRSHGCQWLFYDHSINRSGSWCTRMRWCTMSVCGNRSKARVYRRRHRER